MQSCIQNEKRKKKLEIGFIANAKFLSFLLEQFVDRKLLISEE